MESKETDSTTPVTATPAADALTQGVARTQDTSLPNTSLPSLDLPDIPLSPIAQSSDPVRMTTPHIAPGAPFANPPPDLAQQIRPALEAPPGEPVELTLAPEELGRVRLRLDTDSDAIRLHVQAERPETLDMMRRHIDQLSRDFRDMGFSSVSFQFSGDGGSGHPDGSAQTNGEEPGSATASLPDTTTATPQPRPTPTYMTASGGMDIRL